MSQEALKQVDLDERRKEHRYTAPAIYQKYITLKANDDAACLVDFSRNGIGFVTLQEMKIGECVECSLFVPLSMSHEVLLTVEVRYCQEINGEYIIGSSLKKIEDEVWFELFNEVHNYIVKNEGDLY